MPQVVLVPFGVPEEAEGLGLGLAALIHSFSRMRGDNVALAQLLSKDGKRAVESYVSHAAWKELASGSPSPEPIDTVLTGQLDPPEMGRGSFELVAFDPKSGEVRAREESSFGADDAGKGILETIDAVCKKLDGDAGGAKEIADLSWSSLEHVLRAERAFLPNPLKSGARDRFAALTHLERAIEESPDARFPAARLAAGAMEAAFLAQSGKLREAALRSVTRALTDAPMRVELLEAAAALELRFTNAISAEARILVALDIAPMRGSLYALLCEARRARGDREGAREAVALATEKKIEDPLLFTEDAVLLVEAGDRVRAAARFREVLARWPLFPAAFKGLGDLALREGDAVTAQGLVDAALASKHPVHPDVLRQGIELAMRTESAGVARASRVLSLARSLVSAMPQDAWAKLVLSRALMETGDRTGALSMLAGVEAVAPDSLMAAEAQRGRFQIADKKGAIEVESLLRAVFESKVEELEALAMRGRVLATEYDIWIAPFAVGIAERRRERWAEAQVAFEEAIKRSPGCAPAHVELCGVHVARKDATAALASAERAVKLEGESARTLAVLATALLAAGRRLDAEQTIDRALAMEPQNASHRALAERIRSTPPPPVAKPSWFSSLLRRKV